MNSIRVWAVALLAVALASCSKSPEKPATYPVSGRVLYEGNPATGAVVILHAIGGAATGERPRAKADGKGEFTLSTFTKGDGAPAGEYAVTVEWKRSDDHPEQGVDLLPASYSDPKISKLKVTIAAGSNEPLVLKLTRKP